MEVKKITRVHEMVMSRRMMFGEVVGQVVSTMAPENMKITIRNTVTNPVKMHVHSLGAMLTNHVIDDADGAKIVSLNGSWRLRITKLKEGGMEVGGFFSIVK